MTGVPRVAHNDWGRLDVPELGGWRPTLPVSVVVPARDCQPSLDLTLASLSRQTYPAALLDAVVVDDGSHPPLRLPPVRPANTRLIRVPDGTWGIAGACDAGFRDSTGDLILRLDADMVVVPDHVKAHARWHHRIPYAVTLGAIRFVDKAPGRPGWPTPDDVLAGRFDPADTRPHAYLDRLTDGLRAADHLAFLAHVGATVAVRRELYEAAGGYDVRVRRGSDTEFGYRLAQAGAVFVPDRAARGWHLGASGAMRDEQGLQRYARPFLADLMPHPRWLRREGGSAWAVPLVTVVVPVDGHPLEPVRAAVDAILSGAERDVRVCLVGAWDTLTDERRTVLTDPLLELRLIAASYRSDPRVVLADRIPETAFPSPFLVYAPVTPALGRTSIARLVAEADRQGAGLVRVTAPEGRATVEIWRTAALGRARWVRRDGESLEAVVADTHGVRTLAAAAAGIGPTTRGWQPTTVEVGGLRSWLRATALVARLASARVTSWLRRAAERHG